MVILAQGSSGQRAQSPSQEQNATVMLALLWQNVFAPLFFKEFLSAIWALLRRRPKDEIDDGVTYGGHGWLGRGPVDSFFFLPRVCEAMVLQEGVGNHCHQGVAMKTLP
ncbi:hypothetical protein GGD62_008406 [Bradyrhizobium sp. ERR14]|nr:hypothetical protein [Bradyrhizobium sp. ERR14]